MDSFWWGSIFQNSKHTYLTSLEEEEEGGGGGGYVLITTINKISCSNVFASPTKEFHFPFTIYLTNLVGFDFDCKPCKNSMVLAPSLLSLFNHVP